MRKHRVLTTVALLLPCLLIMSRAYAAQEFHIPPQINNVTQDGATLIWETTEPDTGVVEYGLKGNLDKKATGEAAQIIHRVRMNHLDADTAYSYRVRAGGSVRENTFKTAPATDKPVTFVVVGDSRRWDVAQSQKAIAHAAQWNPDFFINVGDLVLKGHDYKLWPEHFERFEKVSGQVMVVTARGNHEGSQSADPDNDWFGKYHELPGAGEPYAAFDWGNTHFVLVSFEKTEGAAAFLDQNLPASTRKYTVVAQHFPVYCTGYYDPGGSREEDGENQKALAEALDRHHVALDIAGHTHIYERMYPVRAGQRDDRNGCLYIVNGGDINANFPTRISAVTDDREAFEKPTYTVVHMGEDRITFRTFAWAKAAQGFEEIDQAIQWKEEAVPKAAQAALKTAQGGALVTAIQDLGAMLYAPAVPDLVPYLAQQDKALRAAAATALRRIGIPESARALLHYLDDPDLGVRREAARGLEIAMAPEMSGAAAKAVRDPSQDVKTRVCLLGALQLHAPAETAFKTALDVVKNLQAPPPLRERAAFALASTATKKDAKKLLKLFREEPSQYVTLRLALALNEITGNRQSADGKSAIGRSKPGKDRDEFIKKWR